MPTGDERTLVEAGCVDVGVDFHRAVAGLSAVVPRLVPTLRLVEVERQRSDLLLERDAGRRFDRLADAVVELAAAAVGESLVGCVADERVAEPFRATRLGIDEVCEPLPDPVLECDLPSRRRSRGASGRSSLRGRPRSGGRFGPRARAGRCRRRSGTPPSRGASRRSPSGGPFRAARRGTTCSRSSVARSPRYRAAAAGRRRSPARRSRLRGEVAAAAGREPSVRSSSSSCGAHTVAASSLCVTSMIWRRCEPARARRSKQVAGRLVHEVDVLDRQHRRRPARLVERNFIVTSPRRSRRKRSSSAIVSGVSGSRGRAGSRAAGSSGTSAGSTRSTTSRSRASTTGVSISGSSPSTARIGARSG